MSERWDSMITKVKIDTVIYDVEVTAELIIVDGRECKGSIAYDENKIKISNSIGAGQAKVTLMHEIMHGMIFERGISLKESSEETSVDELGKAMLQVIRDNPQLIELLNSD